MQPVPLAFVVYSSQLLLIVCAAAVLEAIARVSAPAVRLTYWRAVATLCLALPFIASTRADLPAYSVTFGVLPAQGAATVAVSRALPAMGPIILWLWACGVIAGVVWLLAGVWRVRQLREQSVPALLEPDIDALRSALAARAEFRWSSHLQQPVTLGVRRPIVLLPRRFDDLMPEARRAVACHELLHVARRDWVWNVLEAHIRVLFWFHPGVWWLIDRVQLMREQVIDELVVRGSSRRNYMLALMMFADSERPTALSSAFLRRRHLKSRLRQLVKESHMSFRRRAWTMAVLTLVMGGVTVATVRALPLSLSAIAQDGAASRLEIRLAETTPAAGLKEVVVSGSNQRIYLYPTTLATWADVTTARVIEPGTSQFGVAVTFNGATAARMASATAAHLGKPVAILLDGRVVSVVTVRSPISDSAVITGITARSASELIDANLACHANPAQCNAAVLPVPIHQEKPTYTPAAMAAQIEGSVLLEAVVLADGSVGDVTVIQSLDSQLGLDQQAVDALKLWTWKPGTRGGEPVRVAVQIQMTFTLK